VASGRWPSFRSVTRGRSTASSASTRTGPTCSRSANKRRSPTWETIGHAIASIQANERLAQREGELVRQNQRLEEFAGIVSHDLRNPLNVAVGNLRPPARPGTKRASKAADALERMDELIADLLTLARQGEGIDEFEPVPLGNVVEEAWATTGNDSSTLACADDLGTLSADRSRLRQLLENVFRNAVEHGSTSRHSSATQTTPWNTVPRALPRTLRRTASNPLAPT